jgi:hypothetical protein
VKCNNNEIQQTTPASATNFIDESEMLKRIPISRGTLFNWRKSGKIPSVKIGRRCLYHYPSIESALLRMQSGGAQ